MDLVYAELVSFSNEVEDNNTKQVHDALTTVKNAFIDVDEATLVSPTWGLVLIKKENGRGGLIAVPFFFTPFSFFQF